MSFYEGTPQETAPVVIKDELQIASKTQWESWFLPGTRRKDVHPVENFGSPGRSLYTACIRSGRYLVGTARIGKEHKWHTQTTGNAVLLAIMRIYWALGMGRKTGLEPATIRSTI